MRDGFNTKMYVVAKYSNISTFIIARYQVDLTLKQHYLHLGSTQIFKYNEKTKWPLYIKLEN